MATDREVLREFLVSLGFEIAPVELRNFTAAVMGSTKMVGKLSAAVLAVAVAGEAMATAFARSMERMYYTSRRTKGSVENLQGLKFAFKQIGLEGEQAMQTIETMAQGLRTQPGLRALLKQFIGEGSGDAVRDLYALVGKLAEMPHEIGSQWAEQFGIPEQVFLQMKDNLPALIAAHEEYIRMQRRSGVSADEAARASKEYMNVIRELWKQIEILSGAVAVKLLPVFKELNQFFLKGLDLLQDWVNSDFFVDFGNFGDQMHELVVDSKELLSVWKNIADEMSGGDFLGSLMKQLKDAASALLDFADGIVSLASFNFSKAASKFGSAINKSVIGQHIRGAIDKILNGSGSGDTLASNNPTAGTAPPPSRAGLAPGELQSFGTQDMFAALEKTYGLPAGALDKMWKQESNRGDPRFMKSPKGALGHFGFMPQTAQQYGVDDPMNLAQSAGGAARMMSAMLKKYQGSIAHALAAYNWGEGNVDRQGLENAPAETKDYISKVAGTNVSLNSKTEVNIYGVADARAAGRQVELAQDRVNGDIVRNLKGALR